MVVVNRAEGRTLDEGPSNLQNGAKGHDLHGHAVQLLASFSNKYLMLP